jgi:hypothetical protein
MCDLLMPTEVIGSGAWAKLVSDNQTHTLNRQNALRIDSLQVIDSIAAYFTDCLSEKLVRAKPAGMGLTSTPGEAIFRWRQPCLAFESAREMALVIKAYGMRDFDERGVCLNDLLTGMFDA